MPAISEKRLPTRCEPYFGHKTRFFASDTVKRLDLDARLVYNTENGIAEGKKYENNGYYQPKPAISFV